MDWEQQKAMAWVGRYAAALIGVVIGVFIFGIILGVGGQGTGRWAGLGFAAGLLVLGRVLVRWIRESLEVAGVPPERVERGVGGMLAVVAVMMIFLGIGGLMYVVSPFDPRHTGWELRLAPILHAEALAVAYAAYILAGVLLLARNWPIWRGR